MIKVSNVHKHFKEIKAVNGIDLFIPKGEYAALLGPNGAGKTTLVEMIEGLQHPDLGEIEIMGKSWKNHAKELHHMIGLSLQETRFIDKLTVYETLRLFASFYRLEKNRIQEIMELVNLPEKRKSFVVNLSGGQRQRLALGIALLNNPKILLLDEPTTGLDPAARREIWDILTSLKTVHKTTMILTTHYMDEAAYLCDKIIIMDKGRILAEGTLEQLLSKHKKGEVISFETNMSIRQGQLPHNDKIIKSVIEPAGNKGEIIVEDLVNYLPSFLDFIRDQQLALTSLECRKMTLDDLFIAMTGRRLAQ